MSCDTQIKSPIINVVLLSKDEKKNYVFVGNNLSGNIKNILSKIESGRTLSSQESKSLIEEFPSSTGPAIPKHARSIFNPTPIKNFFKMFLKLG